MVHRRFPANPPSPDPQSSRFLLPAKIVVQAFLIYGWMLTRPYFEGIEPFLDTRFKWLAMMSWYFLLSLCFQLTKDGLETVFANLPRRSLAK